MPATPSNIAIALFELALLIAGLVLLWRHVFRSAARAEAHRLSPLATWAVSPSDFLIYLFIIAAGGLLASFAVGLIVGPLDLAIDTKTILSSAAFQFGLLIGPAVLPLKLGHHPLLPPLSRSTWLSGLVTFLIALPVVSGVNLAWLGLLKLLKLPAGQQDLLRMFSELKSPGLLALLIVLATIVAPVTEELLFRATLFRYLRTRLPRWIALLLPGAIFASLHVNWATLDGFGSLAPLIMLAVIFSLAYERTGRIGTAMVAHALFNLHTIVLLLAGVAQ